MVLYLIYTNKKGELLMKSFRFEKKGMEFVFRNFHMERYGFKGEWKVLDIAENDNNDDGFYYNAKLDEEHEAILIDFELNGKKMSGVKPPKEIWNGLIEL